MTNPVSQIELPAGTLLDPYWTRGGHVDCYVAEVAGRVGLPELITAFYTSSAFRPERWLIGMLLGKRADDCDVARLAAGQIDRFSAWSVEDRREDEILLCDYQSKTRSWLMVKPCGTVTRLHFGSAVVPARSRVDRAVFTALLGFHAWYSRRLLNSAAARL